MSKWSYSIGSQKGKKAVHQKEVIEKLPKLTSYFTTTTGETSISSNKIENLPHEKSLRSQFTEISESSSSSPISTDFGKVLEPEGDRLCDKSTPTSTTSSTPTTVSLKQQFSNSEETSHDPADYFLENLTEKCYETLIQTNLITSNHPSKKETQNLTTRTYLKEQDVEAHARMFLMALRHQSI
ncbi:hypothetical protein EVAR_44522_1 [Eumeta japonica]|uniref:Uncharacterized protein n=1 Tax=Eumeta variegata TaxID=151549 RepID=A0A4C1YEK2_EUMVA|nr:hypothetical protein EVAR_44522_1 [Eumeta japonica]